MTTELVKILYVEDDRDLSEITMMVLEDLGGFDVEHCKDGFEALEKLGAFDPQLVLMDVMMPGMDGVETFRRMKERDALRGCPVIFMTAKAQTHEQQKYHDIGAIGVLPKPYDPMSLCSEISTLWETAR